nr:MAG TPA: hypothetical protein [Caudoviricetes sp.]
MHQIIISQKDEGGGIFGQRITDTDIHPHNKVNNAPLRVFEEG